MAVGVVLHVGGVYKHAAFDRDSTFGKMLVASSSTEEAASPSPPTTAVEATRIAQN
jgi:hypothetical protein